MIMVENRQIYHTPEMEILMFDCTNVVVTSGDSDFDIDEGEGW